MHRRDVRRAVNGEAPPPRATPSSRPRPVSGPWREWIRQVLVEDRGAPRKQRHTARRIGDRLAAEHGVVISASRVRSVVAELRAELATADVSAVVVPQAHPPGAEAEVDWGGFVAVIGGIQMTLQLFVMRASYSTVGFHRAYAHAAQESWLDAHVRGFARLGGVPRMVRYDNLKTAVTRVLAGRDRVENDRFTSLRSHYLFDSFFCLPGIKGAHEKGGVEGEVGWFRRNHLTPVPVFDTLAGLNAFIDACDTADDARFVVGRGPGAGSTAGDLAVADRAGMWPLPADAFATTTRGTARVDAKARVCVRQCFYSVPARLAGARLAYDLGAETVTVWDGPAVVARHARALHRKAEVLDIDHYLEVLWRKPGAMPGSTALAQARAAGRFTVDYQRFWDLARRRHGDGPGTRAVCEVLLLNRHHRRADVCAGLRAALAIPSTDPNVVAVETRRAVEHPTSPPGEWTDTAVHAPGAHRPMPALDAYDALLANRKDTTR
ncbi:MAG: IS21 family transposase [Candidatus Nanopelagicales bacterium]